MKNTNAMSTQHPHHKLCSGGTFSVCESEREKTTERAHKKKKPTTISRLTLFMYFSLRYYLSILALTATITKKDTLSSDMNEFQEMHKDTDERTEKKYVCSVTIFFLLFLFFWCLSVCVCTGVPIPLFTLLKFVLTSCVRFAFLFGTLIIHSCYSSRWNSVSFRYVWPVKCYTDTKVGVVFSSDYFVSHFSLEVRQQ